MSRMRKTKIICTLGPSSESVEMIEALVNAGMNVARLNFSHGTYKEHLQKIRNVKEVNAKLGTYTAIMADTKGPEIRVGDMGSGVEFKEGDIVRITPEPVTGTKECFQIKVPELFNDITVGNRILMNDGKLTMEVTEIHPDRTFSCRMLNDGLLTSNKSANVPNVKLSMPFISEKDAEDIKFAARNDVDFIAASFTRRAEDVIEIKNLLKELGAEDIEIIAKIENQEGYDNLNEILEVADGIMVARGDLGVEVEYSLVPLFQKRMIRKANEVGKPVITATHMLESMINNPRSTRAEASDVANAVLDGSDCVMLSGESASGKYPVEAVKTMAEIALQAEAMLDYRKYASKSTLLSHRTKNEAIGIAVAESCLTLDDVCAVIAFTETGGTAKRIARFRPVSPVIAATNSRKTARKLALYFGVYVVFDADITEFDFYDITAQRIARNLNYEKGSTMIITSGWKVAHGSTNTIRFLEVE
ncbi:MAG: pyruvate kinase [Clostridia bacterium]|nr:pyruvate kinase [Clostridia bacterium]